VLILKLALRNLARSRSRTIALGALVALTIAAMTLGNALFDGTDAGVRHSYIDSFTGDLSVSEKSPEAFSVFGSQTPVIGSLTRMPTITSFDDVRSSVEAAKGVSATSPIVCGLVVMESGSYRKPVSVFGVDAVTYFPLFPALIAREGRVLREGEQGIMISAARAAAIASISGNKVKVGDSLKLSYYSEGSFELREAPIVGIVAYPLQNETLDSIVIADADTLRGLLGMAREALTRDESAAGKTAGSIDALFSGAKDSKADPKAGLKLGDIESLLSSDESEEDISASSSWNYLLVKLSPGADRNGIAASLDRKFASRGLPVAARDWRETAGASALYVSWLRILFSIGIGIILAAGMIIIVNALVIAVFERTSEIGTMRSLGASRSFVRRLFVAETMILVLGSALIGIALGALVCALIATRGIAISNQTLVTLFGSNHIRPVVTFGSAALNAAIATLIGALVWIYPVRLAIRIEPARAASAE
jgi:putative ABC transport system permease protein